MNGIDISTGTAPSPTAGLLQGVTQGLNAGQLIQEGRARRAQQAQQVELQKQQVDHQKMIDGLGLIKENWVPDDYKIMLYNQNVKPYFADSSVPMPDLKEWPSFGNKAAKELNDIVTNGHKKGMAPQEIETMAALAMSKYEPEFQKQGKPVLDSLRNESKIKAVQNGTQAQSLELRKDNAVRDVIKNFNSDPQVKKAQSMMESAAVVKDLVNSNNPIANSAVPTFMARVSGEVGALSEADKAPFGGSKAMLARANQAIKERAKGTLTDANKKFLIDLTSTLENAAKRSRTDIAKLRSKQFSSHGNLINEADLFKALSPADETSATAEAPAAPSSGGTGRVSTAEDLMKMLNSEEAQ